MESAFGFDITNKQDSGCSNDVVPEVEDLPVVSVFPNGSELTSVQISNVSCADLPIPTTYSKKILSN